MPLQTLGLLPAAVESLGQRVGIFAFCLAFGAYMIFVGRHNVRTKQAEESGKRALFLTMLGKSTTMTGTTAVLTGWLRIVLGVLIIIFGLGFLIFGNFFKH